MSRGDELLIVLRDERHAEQIWRTDGTVSGTRRLDDARALIGDASNPVDLTEAGDALYFVAQDENDAFYTRVWRSQGTEQNTVQLDLGLPRSPTLLGTLDEKVIVFGGAELWATDGTVAGTHQLSDDSTTHASSIRSTAFRNGLLITESNHHPGTIRLLTTDGTLAGTETFTEIESFDDVDQLVTTGDLAFFTLRFEANLWRTDGTAEGTWPIDLPNVPAEPTALGNHLFFRVEQDLWRTDGTAAGTQVLVRQEDLGSSTIASLRAGANRLYFSTFTLGGGSIDIWFKDGGFGPTTKLGTLPCLRCSIGPLDHVVLGDQIVFAHDDGVRGEELWSFGPGMAPTRLSDSCPGACSSQIQGLSEINGKIYFSATDLAHGQEPWTSDGTSQGTYRLADIAAGPSSSEAIHFAPLGDEILFNATTREIGYELWALDPSTDGAGSLLRDSRFEVIARWRTDDGEGSARMQPFSDDTSFFWFFNRENVELIVKVLDGRGFNDAFWVFYGALSNVEYWIDVRDRQTGRTKTYYNPPGETCGRPDVDAFPEPFGIGSAFHGATMEEVPVDLVAAEVAEASAKTNTCASDSESLCLREGRFKVEVDWRSHDGSTGHGQSIVGTDESGYFWFFAPTNVELAVKVLDGRGFNGRFWVFYGALSDVQYTITVTDLETGEQKQYFNPSGEFCGSFDTEAF